MLGDGGRLRRRAVLVLGCLRRAHQSESCGSAGRHSIGVRRPCASSHCSRMTSFCALRSFCSSRSARSTTLTKNCGCSRIAPLTKATTSLSTSSAGVPRTSRIKVSTSNKRESLIQCAGVLSLPGPGRGRAHTQGQSIVFAVEFNRGAGRRSQRVPADASDSKQSSVSTPCLKQPLIDSLAQRAYLRPR